MDDDAQPGFHNEAKGPIMERSSEDGSGGADPVIIMEDELHVEDESLAKGEAGDDQDEDPGPADCPSCQLGDVCCGKMTVKCGKSCYRCCLGDEGGDSSGSCLPLCHILTCRCCSKCGRYCSAKEDYCCKCSRGDVRYCKLICGACCKSKKSEKEWTVTKEAERRCLEEDKGLFHVMKEIQGLLLLTLLSVTLLDLTSLRQGCLAESTIPDCLMYTANQTTLSNVPIGDALGNMAVGVDDKCPNIRDNCDRFLVNLQGSVPQLRDASFTYQFCKCVAEKEDINTVEDDPDNSEVRIAEAPQCTMWWKSTVVMVAVCSLVYVLLVLEPPKTFIISPKHCTSLRYRYPLYLLFCFIALSLVAFAYHIDTCNTDTEAELVQSFVYYEILFLLWHSVVFLCMACCPRTVIIFRDALNLADQDYHVQDHNDELEKDGSISSLKLLLPGESKQDDVVSSGSSNLPSASHRALMRQSSESSVSRASRETLSMHKFTFYQRGDATTTIEETAQKGQKDKNGASVTVHIEDVEKYNESLVSSHKAVTTLLLAAFFLYLLIEFHSLEWGCDSTLIIQPCMDSVFGSGKIEGGDNGLDTIGADLSTSCSVVRESCVDLISNTAALGPAAFRSVRVAFCSCVVTQSGDEFDPSSKCSHTWKTMITVAAGVVLLMLLECVNISNRKFHMKWYSVVMSLYAAAVVFFFALDRCGNAEESDKIKVLAVFAAALSGSNFIFAWLLHDYAFAACFWFRHDSSRLACKGWCCKEPRGLQSGPFVLEMSRNA